MNDMILHVSMDGKQETSPWRNLLTPHGIVVYLAKSRPETMYYHQSYPMVAILIEIDDQDAGALEELIGQIKTLAGEKKSPPIIAMTQGEITLAMLAEWAGRGANDIYSYGAPQSVSIERFVRLRDQAQLYRNVDPENSPAELARLTRRHLHDLSQPLSAVQGKLQLMSIKATEDDPNRESYKELVTLIQRVSAEIMEVHQIQRKMS